jgi:hypothetical protein
MIRYALIILMGSGFLFGLPSCKKAVDNIQKNAAYDIITKGQWKVTKFEKGTASILPEYADYVFQFYENDVVTAFKPGSPDINGVWSASTENLSITTSFPGQSDPLKRFNGTWLITKITETTVEGINGANAEPYTVALIKI